MLTLRHLARHSRVVPTCRAMSGTGPSQLGRHATRVLPACRPMSAGAGPIVDVQDDAGVAVMTLQRAPVNSLNLDLLQTISKSLDDVAKNKPNGMILTSALPTVFSAGLDLTEMYKPDLKRAAQFWRTLQEVWMKLFGAKFAIAAAVNGHAPAGGCLLASSCEYRVMVTGNYTIGLNETALGIGVPHFVMDTMSHTIGTRNAEAALTAAKLFTVDEALKVGLVDELAADKSEAIDKCKKFINKFDRIPSLARSMTKLRIRQGPLSHLQRTRDQDVAEFVANLQNPETQEKLEMYMQRLKAKKAN